jgi:hypothetical protein
MNDMIKYNGRVDITTGKIEGDNKLFQEITSQRKSISQEALRSVQEVTSLSHLFFSAANQKIIQNAIRRTVWEKTEKKYIIGEQDHLQLQIVMRSIYLQYSKNLPYNIQLQISELNHKVVDFCVEKVYSNLIQYMVYKKDVSSLPVPLEQPVSIVKSRKESLVMNNFF